MGRFRLRVGPGPEEVRHGIRAEHEQCSHLVEGQASRLRDAELRQGGVRGCKHVQPSPALEDEDQASQDWCKRNAWQVAFACEDDRESKEQEEDNQEANNKKRNARKKLSKKEQRQAMLEEDEDEDEGKEEDEDKDEDEDEDEGEEEEEEEEEDEDDDDDDDDDESEEEEQEEEGVKAIINKLKKFGSQGTAPLARKQPTGKENVNHGSVEEGGKKRKRWDISLQDMHVVLCTIEDLKNQVTELKKKGAQARSAEGAASKSKRVAYSPKKTKNKPGTKGRKINNPVLIKYPTVRRGVHHGEHGSAEPQLIGQRDAVTRPDHGQHSRYRAGGQALCRRAAGLSP
eukprot:2827152-Rhodomonas_salina.1